MSGNTGMDGTGNGAAPAATSTSAPAAASTSPGHATAPAAGGTPCSPAGGLIDVGGMTLDELSSMICAKDLGRALDYIVASGQNGIGHHGFNSHI